MREMRSEMMEIMHLMQSLFKQKSPEKKTKFTELLTNFRTQLETLVNADPK